MGRAFPSRGMSGGLTACLGGSAITREGGTTWVIAELLPSPEGRRAPALEAWEAWLPAWGSLAASQAGSQASQASQAVTSQAGAHLPPGEGSNLVAQATQSGRQAGAHLSPGEGNAAKLLNWDAAKLLPSPGERWAPACLPDWVACATKLLPSPGGRWAPAWEVTAWEACEAWLPAWDAAKLLPSLAGRWAPAHSLFFHSWGCSRFFVHGPEQGKLYFLIFVKAHKDTIHLWRSHATSQRTLGGIPNLSVQHCRAWASTKVSSFLFCWKSLLLVESWGAGSP